MEQGVNAMGNTSANEQNSIRKYLLGTLDDKAEMSRIEKTLLLEDDFAERLSIAEDELCEDFLDGALDESERARFLQFFLLSPENKEKLRLNRNLRKYAATRKGARAVGQFSADAARRFDLRNLFSLPAVRFAAIALMIFAVGFAVWKVGFYRSNAERGLAQLRLAYRGQRPIESRLSANFDYAPLSDLRGGGGEAVSTAADMKARSRAEGFLLNATEGEEASDAHAHQALGVLYLAEKKFDSALDEFNRALKLAPDDAGLHNDLGAALFEKAKQAERNGKPDESLENLALSLKSFNGALEIDASSANALFNRALVLQKMRLTSGAREAWEKYLEKDSVSPWATEARRNLELLSRQNDSSKDKSRIMRDFLDAYRSKDEARAWEITSQTKELVTGAMIAQQLTEKFLEAAEQSREQETAESLAALIFLGEIEKRNAGDSFFAESARFYATADRRRLEQSRQAHDCLQIGYEQILKPDFAGALKTFERAEKLFSSAGNQWEISIARFQIAYCLSQLGKLNDSNKLLYEIAENCEKQSFRWLQGLVYGWLGSNYSLLGEHSKAIDYDAKSLEIARKISDSYNIQKASTQLAYEYSLIGDSSKMLSGVRESLTAENSYYLSPRQNNRNLIFATESLYRAELYDAASAFGREEVSTAEKNRDNFLNHTARGHLAMIYGAARKYEAAFREIEAGFELADSFGDEAVRARQNARNRLLLSNLQSEAGDCRKAVANYERVIGEYQGREFSINNYAAHKGRLRCYIRLENDDAVREKMPALLEMFDENRQKIVDESDRNVFFDNEQNVYDIAVDYAFTKLKDPERAFDYAENSRARSLLGLIKKDASPLRLAELRRKMPPGAQMIFYAVLADKILIWRVSGADLTVAEKTVGLNELNDKIQKYRKLLIAKNDEEALSDAAKELYALLIEPVESTLEPDKILCIVADKALFRVPFAALVSPQTNRYLIENYELLYAPSATIFVDKTEAAARKASTPSEAILSVGNPSFSPREYPELADLPAAAREAREIAVFYDSAKTLIGDRAVKEEIVSDFNEADVLHFAGHYVPNRKSPALSKLLLASGDLTIEEMTRAKQPRARLVILSACETGVETFYGGEGMFGAARAFLASDIPLVVGSGWSVDSEATARLMIRFHDFRKRRNLSSTAAVRQAQIRMLADERSDYRHPFYWAAFMPIGGYANF